MSADGPDGGPPQTLAQRGHRVVLHVTGNVASPSR
jgi:hypothetical protein